MNKFSIYSKESEKIIRDALIQAEISRRVNVIEWRNFVDFDIIPLIKKFIERNKK